MENWYSNLSILDKLILKYLSFKSSELIDDVIDMYYNDETFSLNTYHKVQLSISKYYIDRCKTTSNLIEILKCKYYKVKHEYLYYELIAKARDELITRLYKK